MTESIAQLCIRELLDGRARYLIPMYQRNYAWQEGEINQLVQDLLDAMPVPGQASRHYYLGSLVVHRRPARQAADDARPLFETLDGQQRLTTLSLLALYLRKRLEHDLSAGAGLCIEFENRPRSDLTLRRLQEAGPDDVRVDDSLNPQIVAGYQLIHRAVVQLIDRRGISLQGFADHVSEQVQIMRVEVPADTDLNHYFEIINSRGEQLEKHEVLKARLLAPLSDDPAAGRCLHLIWEACANMQRYVQAGFTAAQREQVFDHARGGLRIDDFDRLAGLLGQCGSPDASGVALTLEAILAMAPASQPQGHKVVDEAQERFAPVIDFANFLLQVLRVQTGLDIPLDDKRLLESFQTHGPKDADAVKVFARDLLRCRLLFDHYVIKRQFLADGEGWSLKRWGDGAGEYLNTFPATDDAEEGSYNRRILMLQSALHVSAPAQAYKHWLNAALRWLFTAPSRTAELYLDALQSLARALVFDRYLAAEPQDYYTIIHQRHGRCMTQLQHVPAEQLLSRLQYPRISNSLVFNYLDYLLWEHYRGQGDAKINRFVFTFRSSIEHYYPRNPLSGERLADVDRFGNLCLISHARNARLSNFLPEGKKAHYVQQATVDSIKQYLMMRHDTWDAASGAIDEHERQMLEVLCDRPGSCTQARTPVRPPVPPSH